MLFEFSNRIGAFATYVLIQAMNPNNNNLENKKEQEALVQEWVN